MATLGALASGLRQLPVRGLAQLVGPVRADLRRRAIGGLDKPRPVAMDPATAFLRPGGVARRVHGDLPSMLIGGISALLLQALHPLAMAGVADHSSYATDPVGRLRRTARFVSATTYGTVAEAHEALDQVREVHRGVRGVAPDGRPYSAFDPELVTWIHVAEMWSFLSAARRYGPLRLSSADCDAYLEETAVIATELGARWVPRSVDQATAYFARMRPELYAGPQAIEARNFLARGPGQRPEDRAIYAVLFAGAVTVLPGWARTELEIPAPPLVDRLLVVPVARSSCALLRWAVGARRQPEPVAP